MSDTKRVPVGLKPCPFCGSSAALVWSDVDGKYRHYFGNCEACGGAGGWARTESRAAEKWNARAAAPPDDELARLERDVRNELARAMTKFPTWPTDPIHAAMVIAEESGELMRATLQACYEPMKAGSDHVREEAIQTAAMCLRFLLSLRKYKFEPGPQHEQVRVKEGE